jgi:hypothetical protein
MQTTFTWAPGGQHLVLPDNVHLKVGGDEGGYLSFGNNIHYDNRNAVEEILDSTGVRWYYVNQPRENEAGVLYTGDAIVGLRGQSVGARPTKHTFSCPGTCSAAVFGDEPSITVFIEALHEHESGVRVVSEIRRDGELVHRTSVENFDFESNGRMPVQQDSYTVLPGDSFHTTCYYDNVDNTTLFGFGSQEEMCQSIFFYYPRTKQLGQAFCGPGFPDPRCAAAYEVTPNDGMFDREFGVARDTYPETISPSSAGAGVRVAWFAVVGTAALLIPALVW